MIKRQKDMDVKINKEMKGGSGEVHIKHVLNAGEYTGKTRLVGVISMEPGSSIGAHIHENEEEIFYVLKGTATYLDNGKTEVLNTGDSCICKGGEKHALANKGDTELAVFAVILTY